MGVTEQIGKAKGRRLDSWKAIAQYLGRDVRSVQRWEQERGLPVHRLPGEKSSAVFAYEDELDRWLLTGERGVSAPGTTTPPRPGLSSTPVAEMESPAAAPRGFQGRGLGALVVVALAALAVTLAVVRWRSAEPIADSAHEFPSIAVLPMLNLSGDRAQDYFADGFTDELVTELAQIRALRVISRTSTMVYKGSRKSLPQIAGELRVKYILEGSVAREGQRVRVIAQLIDAPSDTHISARTYNADVKDVFDIQSQISRAIADDVRLDLSPAEKIRLAAVREIDPQAHDLYLKASYAYAQQTPVSIRQSLDLYRAAAAKDSSFALAYVGIAQAETALLQITAEAPEESVLREKAALGRALAINPHLGDARGLLASLDYFYYWDWPRAERNFRLALADGAQAPTEQRYGSALVTRGRFGEATAHLQRALELDPLGKSPRVNAFFGLYFQRRYAEARRELDALMTLSPDFLAGHVMLGLVAKLQNDCTQAGLQSDWMNKHFPSPLAYFVSALASACRDDIAAARQDLERGAASKGPGYASPYQLALGYASIHDREAALSYLEKSADMHEPQALYLKVEPLFDSIRSDPRYVALEKRLGLDH
jgi:TolB-like protein